MSQERRNAGQEKDKDMKMNRKRYIIMLCMTIIPRDGEREIENK